MKKRISAELISIAHRILKLKNHSETLQLQQEAKNLYDQLTILRFYEENFELVKNEIPEAVFEEMLEGKPSEVFTTPKVEEVETKVETTISEIEPEILEPQPEEKIVVAELTLEESEEEALLETTEVANEVEEEVVLEEVEEIEEQKPETTVNQKETVAKQISFEDMLVHDYQELDFVKVDEVPVAVEKATDSIFEAVPDESIEIEKEVELKSVEVVSEPKDKKSVSKEKKEEKTMSLNDKLNKGINIGLNDRIAFEKKLFGGNADDFNRVLSQLNTFDNFEEAQSFILDFVKPDYNNWEGNEEYEVRFLEIVENKFK
jgi:hypothetical protein